MSRRMTLDKKSPFGRLVVIRLKEMDKSQKYLAQEAGLSELYVYQLLKGKYNPSLRTVYEISKVTGLDVEELMKAVFEKS